MRQWLLLFALLGLCPVLGGCDDDDDGNGDGDADSDGDADGDGDGDSDSDADLNWFSSDCSDLGGEETAAGACYFPCESNADCDYGTECCNLPYQPYCRLGRNCGDSCAFDTFCGPSGWKCSFGACYLKCATPSSGAQSPECPDGYECEPGSVSSSGNLCSPIEGSGGGCGEPCPSGCCSPSGLSCCQPPFCAGDCVGSPCC